MEALTFETACKIVETTSSIFQQGDSWVLRVWDLDSGAERLTRGLSLKKATSNLMSWRKNKIDDLLRNDPEQLAWVVHIWEENPTWRGAGLWQPAEHAWHLIESDAQDRLQQLNESQPSRYDVKSAVRTELPRHFELFQREEFIKSFESGIEKFL